MGSLIEIKLLFVLLVVYSLVLAGLKYFGKYGGSWIDCFSLLVVFLAVIGAFSMAAVFMGGK